MSFILDALRKSDAERQRSATPGLADVRYRQRPARRELWLPVLVVVLAINVLIMLFLWLRPSPPAVIVAAPPPATAGAGTVVAPAYPEVRPLAQEADLEPEEAGGPAPEPNVVVEMAETPPAPGGAAAGTPAGAVMAAPARPVADGMSVAPAGPPSGAAAPASGIDLPTAEQLIAAGGLNTPALNLDLHVYSASPASRFVVINTRKYKEGARIQEGPTVESITPDGVILDNQGSRFVIPRK